MRQSVQKRPSFHKGNRDCKLPYSTQLRATVLQLWGHLSLYSYLPYYMLLYSTLRNFTLCYPTPFYSTLLYATPRNSVLLFPTLLCSTLHYITLLCAMLRYCTLLYAMLLHSTLRYFTLLDATPHYATCAVLYSILPFPTPLFSFRLFYCTLSILLYVTVHYWTLLIYTSSWHLTWSHQFPQSSLCLWAKFQYQV